MEEWLQTMDKEEIEELLKSVEREIPEKEKDVERLEDAVSKAKEQL